MSAEQVEAILRRAENDEEFREQLRHHPDAAMHGYDLEYSERQALIAGDAAKLRDMGVNPDLSLLADEYNPRRQDPTTR